MLVIRLARVGRKNQASFRLVAAEKLRTPTGKFVDLLGHYNPHSKEFEVDKEKLAGYFKNGAQPSGAVIKLLKRNKIDYPKWAEGNLVTKKRAPKVKKNDGDEAAKATPDKATESKDAIEEKPAETATPEKTAEEKKDKPTDDKPEEPKVEDKPDDKPKEAKTEPEKKDEPAKKAD